MGRHNREGRGADQQGYEYQVSYQPDWLRLIKVTRTLDSGRQSTKTLFRNPTHRRSEEPSEKVRTRLVSPGQGLEMEVSVSDPSGCVSRVQVTCMIPTGDGGSEEVVYTLEDSVPPAT
ncbi:MAG TPA: hypothetical protein EYQ64_09875 [Gemmatimonadetes bacterium]|nr:hypothetical protein [Gemmatimonadota bacterium]